jgi:uncharacterized membrane protein YuzA (DUF378 family)
MVSPPRLLSRLLKSQAASVPGLTLMGYLTDRYPLFYVLCGSCVAASMSCFFLWGFGTSNVMLVMFVLVFGLLGVSITAFWSKLITIVAGVSAIWRFSRVTAKLTRAEDDPTLPQHIFCIFAFVRGIGNISSGASMIQQSLRALASSHVTTPQPRLTR